MCILWVKFCKKYRTWHILDRYKHYLWGNVYAADSNEISCWMMTSLRMCRLCSVYDVRLQMTCCDCLVVVSHWIYDHRVLTQQKPIISGCVPGNQKHWNIKTLLWFTEYINTVSSDNCKYLAHYTYTTVMLLTIDGANHWLFKSCISPQKQMSSSGMCGKHCPHCCILNSGGLYYNVFA